MANRSTVNRSKATLVSAIRRTYKNNRTNRKNYCRTNRTKTSITGGAAMKMYEFDEDTRQ